MNWNPPIMRGAVALLVTLNLGILGLSLIHI